MRTLVIRVSNKIVKVLVKCLELYKLRKHLQEKVGGRITEAMEVMIILSMVKTRKIRITLVC